jgi:hypothetical protein
VWGESENPLFEWLTEHDADCDDTEYVAVAVEEGPVMLRYHAEPPRLTVEGKVQ